jgi:hypothetical protein
VLKRGEQEEQVIEEIVKGKEEDSKRVMEQFNIQKIKELEDYRLVGDHSVRRFNQKFKNFDKEMELDELTGGRKDSFMRIITHIHEKKLLPRRLNLVKPAGNEYVLNFAGYKLSSPELALVGNVIEHEWRFTSINLSDNNLRAPEVEELFPKLMRMRVINLAHNVAGTRGCVAIARALGEYYCEIEELSLESNRISDQAGASILRAVAGSRIRKVNMACNMLAKKSALALQELFASNHRYLNELIFHWNEFGEGDMLVVSEGMGKYTRDLLKVIDFSWNNIGGSNRAKLKNFTDFLERTHLLHLDLSFCRLTLLELTTIKLSLSQMDELVGYHLEGNLQDD